MPQKGYNIGKIIQNCPHRPAQSERIRPASHTQGGHVEHPHPAVSPDKGVDEQGEGKPHPEQGVQQVLQPAPAQPVAEQAHTVVGQARRPAQYSRSAEQGGLIENFNFHRIQISHSRIFLTGRNSFVYDRFKDELKLLVFSFKKRTEGTPITYSPPSAECS